ncbi:MAG TPA: hypothetical protein VFY29_18715 [Terriglobia bacterium]|nr:hypothetical protein [Terriglobia bacterium]
MICPLCASHEEMAYSALSHAFICVDTDCEFELEMDPLEAQELLEPDYEHVGA